MEAGPEAPKSGPSGKALIAIFLGGGLFIGALLALVVFGGIAAYRLAVEGEAAETEPGPTAAVEEEAASAGVSTEETTSHEHEPPSRAAPDEHASGGGGLELSRLDRSTEPEDALGLDVEDAGERPSTEAAEAGEDRHTARSSVDARAPKFEGDPSTDESSGDHPSAVEGGSLAIPDEEPKDPSSPARPTPKNPTATLGDVRIEGLVVLQETQRILRRHQDEIRVCYASEAEKREGLQGEVELRITIDAAGLVRSVSVHRSTVNDRALEQCILTRHRRWRLAQPRGGGTAVVFATWLLEGG